MSQSGQSQCFHVSGLINVKGWNRFRKRWDSYLSFASKDCIIWRSSLKMLRTTNVCAWDVNSWDYKTRPMPETFSYVLYVILTSFKRQFCRYFGVSHSSMRPFCFWHPALYLFLPMKVENEFAKKFATTKRKWLYIAQSAIKYTLNVSKTFKALFNIILLILRFQINLKKE